MSPGSPKTSEDEEWHAFLALGKLNLHPGSVGSIFADQAEREQRAGLDVAAQVCYWPPSLRRSAEPIW